MTTKRPKSTDATILGASRYPEVDAARRTLANRLDNVNSPRSAREKDYEAYLAALRATGLPLARVASLDAMVEARR